MQQANLGLVGGGTVGGGVFQAIQRNGALVASRLGVRLVVAKVAVRDLAKARPVKVPAAQLTTDWQSVVNDPGVDIVVELMGGTTTARNVVLQALKLGKPVVTANKALLSAHGVVREGEGDEEAFGAFGPAHRRFKLVNVRAAGLVLLLPLESPVEQPTPPGQPTQTARLGTHCGNR